MHHHVQLGSGAMSFAKIAEEPAPEPLASAIPWLLPAGTPTYGYEPPPLLARADATAPRSAVTAINVARVADRIFLTTRLGMPGSFRAQARDSEATVCSRGAVVNYC